MGSVLLVYSSPRALFAQIEDTGAYGWALVALLGLLILIGYAEVQTGLIDRAVDRHTERALAKLEETQGHLLDRVELSERLEEVRKAGGFGRTLARLRAIVFSPAYVLSSLLIIASLLYAVVALTGRKPEYHTLMAVCVYSAFVELAGRIVRLAMVVYYRTPDLDTSLANLAEPGAATFLTALDPFRAWFWVLVAIGLITTRQLDRRRAAVSCTVMALVAAGAQVAISHMGARS